MRIGILGGTFDPPHNAHVALAQAAHAALPLDRLLIVPSGDPPYKKCYASEMDRFAMVRAAFSDMTGIEISEMELVHAGATYAVDTVRALRDEYPHADVVYILGADAARKLPLWTGFDALKELCAFVYAAREGTRDASAYAMRIEAEIPAISSSAVRDLIAEGKSARELIPNAVNDYIHGCGLYIADRPEDEIVKELEACLSPHRFRHILGVRDTAIVLAKRNGLAPGKARIAGLLHDCAKSLQDAELVRLAERAGADAAERADMRILHAPIGALYAMTHYGVRDAEVLSAIRRHTVGGTEMSLLDMIVYVSDYIEPSRADFSGLQDVRALAIKDIRRAAALCAQMTIDYTRSRGRRVHPATAEMIRELDDGGIVNG